MLVGADEEDDVGKLFEKSFPTTLQKLLWKK
jgi:hypothetical protein